VNPFEVGTGATFTALTGGELYLTVNDNNFYDNSGTWNINITVSGINSLPVPTITEQPQSQAAAVGSYVAFSVPTTDFQVMSNGALPLGYQWFQNGVGIPNATNSTYGIFPTQTNNAGIYSVVVSNMFGSVTSAVAQLAVFVPSTIQTSFDDLSTPTVSGEFQTGLMPSVYASLNWNNFYVVNGVLATNTGFYAGVVSSSNVVYNGNGSAAYFYSSSLFDFTSADLTAGWNDNLRVQVLGVTGSTITYSNVFTLSATIHTNILFNYLGVTEVYFQSSGGTLHPGYSVTEPAEQFAMDNVIISTNLAVGVLPSFQTATKTGNTIAFNWGAIVGQTYQVQYKSNLTQTSWFNLGNPVIATNGTMSVSDSLTNSQRFYRILLSQSFTTGV
jgi:hypothetical protein